MPPGIRAFCAATLLEHRTYLTLNGFTCRLRRSRSHSARSDPFTRGRRKPTRRAPLQACRTRTAWRSGTDAATLAQRDAPAALSEFGLHLGAAGTAQLERTC